MAGPTGSNDLKPQNRVKIEIKTDHRDKILSIERAAAKSWSEYATIELKSEKLIK